MKSLILTLLLLGFTPAMAGPGDDPIFPWPTGIETRTLVPEDISGDWVAYAYTGNDTFYVHIQADESVQYRIQVLVKPTNRAHDDGKPRLGIGYWGRHLFWGHISMDGERYTRMVIYRDHGVLKIRIEKPFKQGYYDLRLEKWPWGKPL